MCCQVEFSAAADHSSRVDLPKVVCRNECDKSGPTTAVKQRKK